MKIYNLLSYIVILITLGLVLSKGELSLSILPISFVIARLLLKKLINNKNLFITQIIYDVFGFIRLVILPLVLVSVNDKKISNLPIGYNFFHQGILLIAAEYIIGVVFFILIANMLFKKKYNELKNFKLAGSKIFYYIFIIFIASLVILVPQVRQTLSFIIIESKANTGRGSEEVSSLLVLVRMFVQLMLLLLFSLSSYSNYKKYKCTSRFTYVIFPLFWGLVNISLIVGERRSIQLYTIAAVLFLISLLFKKHSKRINIIILGMGIFILGMMTLYKELYLFNYDSITQAINAKSASNINFADQLQSYFYGPHNIGASIYFSQVANVNITNLIYDIARSIFGMNFLLKDNHLITSQLFNNLIYGDQLTGHLISSAGYGYIYLSYLFFIPLLFNLFITCLCEWILRRLVSIELIFICMYIYMRMALNMFSNPIPNISFITPIIIIYGVVISIAVLMKSVLQKG